MGKLSSKPSFLAVAGLQVIMAAGLGYLFMRMAGDAGFKERQVAASNDSAFRSEKETLIKWDEAGEIVSVIAAAALMVKPMSIVLSRDRYLP